MGFQDRYAARTRSRRTSIIRDLMRVANLPGMISLGGGYPSPRTFPLENVSIQAWDGTYSLAGAELITDVCRHARLDSAGPDGDEEQAKEESQPRIVDRQRQVAKAVNDR